MTRATATLAAPARRPPRRARDRRAASTRVSSTNASVTADVESLAAWVTDQGGDVSATIVGEGERGRGLFASRDLEAGEVVLRVPIGSALNDGRATTVSRRAVERRARRGAAPRARERRRRASVSVRAEPSFRDDRVPNSSFGVVAVAADLLADDAAFDELERYDFLLRLRGGRRNINVEDGVGR